MADRRASLGVTCLLFIETFLGCRTAPPRASIPGGDYTCPQMVALTDTAAGASIFYTTDGSSPHPSSPKYALPITVSNTQTVKSIAVAPPLKSSKVTSAHYVCAQFGATRRAFAVLLQRTFQLPNPQHTIDFPDLSSTDPDFAAIQAAAPFMLLRILCRGCMLGATFGPDIQVSRAGSTISIVGILASRSQLQIVSIADTNRLLSGVVDVNDIPVEARGYFATAIKYGILSVSPDRKVLPHSGYTPTELTTLVQTVGKQFGYGTGTVQ